MFILYQKTPVSVVAFYLWCLTAILYVIAMVYLVKKNTKRFNVEITREEKSLFVLLLTSTYLLHSERGKCR